MWRTLKLVKRVYPGCQRISEWLEQVSEEPVCIEELDPRLAHFLCESWIWCPEWAGQPSINAADLTDFGAAIDVADELSGSLSCESPLSSSDSGTIESLSPVELSEDCAISLSELMFIFLQRQLIKTGWKQTTNNILLEGMDRRVESFAGLKGAPKLSMRTRNQNVNFVVSSPEFRWLHSKIGDHRMMQVWQQCTVLFKPWDSGGECFQYAIVCGNPLWRHMQMNRHKKLFMLGRLTEKRIDKYWSDRSNYIHGWKMRRHSQRTLLRNADETSDVASTSLAITDGKVAMISAMDESDKIRTDDFSEKPRKKGKKKRSKNRYKSRSRREYSLKWRRKVKRKGRQRRNKRAVIERSLAESLALMQKPQSQTHRRFADKTGKISKQRKNEGCLEVARHKLMYDGSGHSSKGILPRNHPLMILPHSRAGAELLIRHIFLGQSLVWFADKRARVIATAKLESEEVRSERLVPCLKRRLSNMLGSQDLSNVLSKDICERYTPPKKRTRKSLRRAMSQPPPALTSVRRKLFPPHRQSTVLNHKEDLSSLVDWKWPQSQPARSKSLPVNKPDSLVESHRVRIVSKSNPRRRDALRIRGDPVLTRKGDRSVSPSKLLKKEPPSRSASLILPPSDNETELRKHKVRGLSASEKRNPQMQGRRMTIPLPTRKEVRILGGKLPIYLTQMTPFFRRLLYRFHHLHQWKFRSQLGMDKGKRIRDVSEWKDRLQNGQHNCKQLMQFIVELLHRLMPKKKNWGLFSLSVRRQFQRLVYRILVSPRHQRMDINVLVSNQNAVWFDLCRSDTSIGKRKKMLRRYLYWLINELVVPAVGHLFYATETSQPGMGLRLAFYPSRVWRQICKFHLSNHPQFSPISKPSIWRVISDHPDTSHGLGFLRFVPKKDGVRPIVNLNRRTRLSLLGSTESMSLDPCNSHLRQVFSILRYQVRRRIEERYPVLGFSVFCAADYYTRWREFTAQLCRVSGVKDLIEYRKKLKNQSDDPPAKVYCVSLDLTKCYDNLRQSKLLEIVESEVFGGTDPNSTITLTKYARLSVDQSGSVIQDMPWLTYLVNGDSSWQAKAKRPGMRSGIFSETGVREEWTVARVMGQLEYHVRNALVCASSVDGYYKLKGIFQGSILSQLLCCIYIGFYENHVIRPLLKKFDNSGKHCRCLMRHVDDFVLFTTDESEARMFAELLHSGDSEYNISANPSKTQATFDLGNPDVPFDKDSNRESIDWCGYTWNTRTLEISLDIREHSTGNIRNSLVTPISSDLESQQHTIMVKMQRLLRHKLNGLVLDGSLQSLFSVCRNLYQLFFVNICKLVRMLLLSHMMGEDHFIMALFFDCAVFCFDKIKRLCSNNESLYFPLNHDEVSFVCVSAIIDVLTETPRGKDLYMRLIGDPVMEALHSWKRDSACRVRSNHNRVLQSSTNLRFRHNHKLRKIVF